MFGKGAGSTGGLRVHTREPAGAFSTASGSRQLILVYRSALLCDSLRWNERKVIIAAERPDYSTSLFSILRETREGFAVIDDGPVTSHVEESDVPHSCRE